MRALIYGGEMKALLVIFAGLSVQAQELTITLKTGPTETTKTIRGAPVAAALEVLEAYRLTQCAEYEPAPVRGLPGAVCLRYKYADATEIIAALLAAQVRQLSERFPTSATAPERAAKSAADAALEAKRALLFDSIKP